MPNQVIPPTSNIRNMRLNGKNKKQKISKQVERGVLVYILRPCQGV